MATGISLPENKQPLFAGSKEVGGGKIAAVRKRRSEGRLKSSIISMWAAESQYDEIADALNEEFQLDGPYAIGAAYIAKAVHEQLEFWRDKAANTMDEKIALVLMRYNQIEELASEDYFKSRQGKVTHTTFKKIQSIKNKKMGDKVKAAVELERLGQSSMVGSGDDELRNNINLVAEEIRNSAVREADGPGDPRFLKIMMDINDKRCQLWSLFKTTGTVNGDAEFAKMSDEARTERIATIVQQAKNRALGNQNTVVHAPLGGFAEDQVPTPEQMGLGIADMEPEDETVGLVVPQEQKLTGGIADEFEWE